MPVKRILMQAALRPSPPYRRRPPWSARAAWLPGDFIHAYRIADAGSWGETLKPGFTSNERDFFQIPGPSARQMGGAVVPPGDRRSAAISAFRRRAAAS